MNDPILEETCRARDLQPHVLRRLQRHLADVIDPLIGDHQRLKEENASLRGELEALRTKAARRRREAEVPA
jgi:hypothetical protein